MIVVSDSTPLITLMKAARIDLLHDLFGEIIIPEAVYQELTINSNFPDEASGRRVALDMGIEIMGSVGVLVTAFKGGYISVSEAEEAFRKIRSAKRHISERLSKA